MQEVPRVDALTVAQWRAFYGSLGLTCIPLRPREKRPVRRGWREGDSRQWEGVPRDANLGVLTGAISGDLVVLDFDTGDGPFDVLGLRPAELAARTLVVRTTRGWHVYARAVAAATCSPRGGLDVRGEGALVAAPPSVHPSGAAYQFEAGPARIAELTDFCAREVIDVGIARGAPGEVDMAAIEEWIAAQWPALQASWARLKRPSGSYDPSKADFAVALCLWEGGYSAEDVAQVLCSLPGSRAAERGHAYALLTARRAAHLGAARTRRHR